MDVFRWSCNSEAFASKLLENMNILVNLVTINHIIIAICESDFWLCIIVSI